MGAAADLLNLIRREIAREVPRRIKPPRHGVVSAYNPNTAAVKVSFHEDLDQQGNPKQTGWIPWHVQSAGNGWTMMCAPVMGMQVAVHFAGGDGNSAYATGAIHSTAQPPPPGGVPEGEFWMLHKSGTFLKFNTAGEIESGAGTWNHTGNLTVSGSITSGGNVAAQAGVDGSFTTPTGNIVTVKAGVITNIK
jgi:phage baseplate assembly protein gpV